MSTAPTKFSISYRSYRENDAWKMYEEKQKEKWIHYLEKLTLQEEKAIADARKLEAEICNGPNFSTASRSSEPLAETSETAYTEELTSSANDSSVERGQAGHALTSALKSRKIAKPRTRKIFRIIEPVPVPEPEPELEWWEAPLPDGIEELIRDSGGDSSKN